jgi:hypothetical protein
MFLLHTTIFLNVSSDMCRLTKVVIIRLYMKKVKEEDLQRH